jgi:ferredoxin
MRFRFGHSVERLAGPIAERAMLRALSIARFVPGVPMSCFSAYRFGPTRWDTFTRPIPEELKTVAGIRRDSVAEEEAFREAPLPSWRHKYDEASLFAYRKLWRSLLPVFPNYMRAMTRVERTSGIRPAARRSTIDPVALTREVKDFALGRGVSAIGIAPYDPKYMFDNYELPNSGDRVLVLVVEQDWAATQKAPSVQQERAAFVGYVRGLRVSADLAGFLVSRGYDARSHHDPSPAVTIHYALESGLGQLGLNGQLLTPQAGSRCRLITLETNAPLVFDAPRDYGIPTLCDACQACVQRCPSGAIPNKRRMHRGVEKIKINTSRCFPLVAQAHGCSVCMKVCPVQRYGLGPVLDEYERSGGILGKGTDELEGYDWPLDGKHYGIGQRPPLPPAFITPSGTNWDLPTRS